jgi:hypothetical protein
MTQIFRIKNDGYKFQALALDVDDFIDFLPEDIPDTKVLKFSYFNLQFAQWWGEVRSSFMAAEGEPNAAIPDISTWVDATLVLSPRAKSILMPVLNGYGEFLPVLCEDQIFYIFNCLTFAVVDEINSKKDIQEGAYMGMSALRFNKIDTAKKAVFKTKTNRCSDIFCGIEFKNVVESEKLSGIIFDSNLEGHF